MAERRKGLMRVMESGEGSLAFPIATPEGPIEVHAAAALAASPVGGWQRLAHGVADRLGDAAIVHLLGRQRRSIRVAALHHTDPAARAQMLDSSCFLRFGFS